MNGETETKRRKSGTKCTQQAIFSATKEKSDRRRRFGHAEEVGREQRDLQARHSVPRIQDSSAAGADGQEDDLGAAHHEHQEKRHQQRIRVWQGHCKRHDHHSDRLGEEVPVHQGCEHQQKDQRWQEIEDDSDDKGCNSKGATSSVKSTRERQLSTIATIRTLLRRAGASTARRKLQHRGTRSSRSHITRAVTRRAEYKKALVRMIRSSAQKAIDVSVERTTKEVIVQNIQMSSERQCRQSRRSRILWKYTSCSSRIRRLTYS